MKQIKLQISESTYLILSDLANKQGVSLEALCVSMLEDKCTLIEPPLYASLGRDEIGKEVRKVLQSSLSREEKNKRVRQLEVQITRRIR